LDHHLVVRIHHVILQDLFYVFFLLSHISMGIFPY
jgi:hypothetical protein